MMNENDVLVMDEQTMRWLGPMLGDMERAGIIERYTTNYGETVIRSRHFLGAVIYDPDRQPGERELPRAGTSEKVFRKQTEAIKAAVDRAREERAITRQKFDSWRVSLEPRGG